MKGISAFYSGREGGGIPCLFSSDRRGATRLPRREPLPSRRRSGLATLIPLAPRAIGDGGTRGRQGGHRRPQQVHGIADEPSLLRLAVRSACHADLQVCRYLACGRADDRTCRPWRMVLVTPSLDGLRAAVQAGLDVTAWRCRPCAMDVCPSWLILPTPYPSVGVPTKVSVKLHSCFPTTWSALT